MLKLAQKTNALKVTQTAKLIALRERQFQAMQKASNEKWFSELCFCILTANSSAEKGMQIQNALGAKGFLALSQKRLAKKLKSLGYRFYNRRAQFIVEARKNKNIKDKIAQFASEFDARDWLVQNIKGIGFKEASHFLRNVGFKNLAILDRHILSLLHENKMIAEKPKSVSERCYLDAEKKLSELAEQTRLTQSELDLYLWFFKTGKVLK